jgi:hypothetical protein
MRRVAAPLVALLLMVATTTEAGVLAMVVADATYARVWDAAVRAVEGYPIERAGEGTIVTGWLERPPREGEPAFTRVLERLTVRVESSARLITRVTVDVEAQGLGAGGWVPIENTEPAERAILARVRPSQS